MNICLSIVVVTFINFASCRDFYVGMFKKNDWLVAQDRLYKERVPYKYMYAKYGRVFKCKITYFRVTDRLGYRPGPKVQIIRGGLNHKYLVLRLTSPYNKPISVNIYVGCANTFTTRAERHTSKSENTTEHITAGSQNSNGATTVEAKSSDTTQTIAAAVTEAQTTVAKTARK